MHRIFIDEVGNHDLKSCDDPKHRYLGLVGTIMELSYESGEFTDKLDELKNAIFGTRDVVLHRREIMEHVGVFARLNDTQLRDQFDNLLLTLINAAHYSVITVVIDKLEHRQRYKVWRFHPYHYCLTVMLERYVQWMERHNLTGDVLAEARGKKENKQLTRAYRYIYKHGSPHVKSDIFRARLTSSELKLKPKLANVSGLQLTDLIASPACRHFICAKTKAKMTAQYGQRIVNTLIRTKYLRNPYNRGILGWGAKWLP